MDLCSRYEELGLYGWQDERGGLQKSALYQSLRYFSVKWTLRQRKECRLL